MTWIKTDDRRPMANQLVLVLTVRGEYRLMRCRRVMHTDYWEIEDGILLRVDNVTHWAALPDKPRENNA